MLGSPLLGTAVGLVLLFATTALLCSGITEWLSNVLQLRAKYLLTGMRAILDEPEKDGPAEEARRGALYDRVVKPYRSSKGRGPDTLHERVKRPGETEKAVEDVRARMAGRPVPVPVEAPVTTALWQSPLLTALQSRRVGVLRQGTVRIPQYVSGRTFAKALVDLLVATDEKGTPPVVLSIRKVREAVEKLPEDWPVRRTLLAFLARAGTSVEAFEDAVAQWYDEQMAKINGWYKRWSRVILGLVGFLVAVALNVDTVQVGHSLYVDAPVQQAVAAVADSGTLCQGEPDLKARQVCVDGKLNDLRMAGIPFGYTPSCHWLAGEWRACWAWSDRAPPDGWDPWRKLLGWLITAFAVSFGAPFWFEALSKLGSLRNAGTKPSSSTSS